MRPARNFQHVPQDAFSSLISMALSLLCLLGIGGVLFNLLSPGGLLEPMIEAAWQMHPGVAVLTITGLVLGAKTAKSTLESYDRSNTDSFWYLFQGLGVFFAYRLLTTGTL
jgi:hypothetical protein